jgi:hypothetical protein
MGNFCTFSRGEWLGRGVSASQLPPRCSWLGALSLKFLPHLRGPASPFWLGPPHFPFPGPSPPFPRNRQHSPKGVYAGGCTARGATRTYLRPTEGGGLWPETMNGRLMLPFAPGGWPCHLRDARRLPGGELSGPGRRDGRMDGSEDSPHQCVAKIERVADQCPEGGSESGRCALMVDARPYSKCESPANRRVNRLAPGRKGGDRPLGSGSAQYDGLRSQIAECPQVTDGCKSLSAARACVLQGPAGPFVSQECAVHPRAGWGWGNGGESTAWTSAGNCCTAQPATR